MFTPTGDFLSNYRAGKLRNLATSGLIATGSTFAETVRSQKEEFDRWGPLVMRIGFTAES
jgi:hypothetical protein